MIRRGFGLAALALAAASVPALATARPAGVLYKNPQCDCCESHASYLRQFGYQLEIKPSFDLVAIKRQNGIPEALDGCHTIVIGGYVVEGHVPAGAIDRLLDERPPIRGIAVPGMPAGSPGMLAPGESPRPLTVYEVAAGQATDPAPKVFGVF